MNFQETFVFQLVAAELGTRWVHEVHATSFYYSTCDNRVGSRNGELTCEEAHMTLGNVRQDRDGTGPIRRRARRFGLSLLVKPAKTSRLSKT